MIKPPIIDVRGVDLRTDVPCITSCTRAAMIKPPIDAMRRIYAAGIAVPPISADLFRNITSA